MYAAAHPYNPYAPYGAPPRQGLTGWQIAGLALAGVVVVGGVVWYVRSERAKPATDFGFRVDEQCNKILVQNQARMRTAVAERVRAMAAAGEKDPLVIGHRIFEEAAPHCGVTFFGRTRTPINTKGRAAITSMLSTEAAFVLHADGILEDVQLGQEIQRIEAFAKEKGLSADELRAVAIPDPTVDPAVAGCPPGTREVDGQCVEVTAPPPPPAPGPTPAADFGFTINDDCTKIVMHDNVRAHSMVGRRAVELSDRMTEALAIALEILDEVGPHCMVSNREKAAMMVYLTSPILSQLALEKIYDQAKVGEQLQLIDSFMKGNDLTPGDVGAIVTPGV